MFPFCKHGGLGEDSHRPFQTLLSVVGDPADGFLAVWVRGSALADLFCRDKATRRTFADGFIFGISKCQLCGLGQTSSPHAKGMIG